MTTFFSTAAAVTLLLGTGWLFFPITMLSLWGVEGDRVAVYMSQRYAGMYFGYTAILWLARASAASPARTAIIAGGFVVTAVMGAISLYGAVTGTVGAAAWGAVVVELLLAAGFAYFYRVGR